MTETNERHGAPVELPRREYTQLVHDSALLEIVTRVLYDQEMDKYDKIDFLQTLFAGKRPADG